MKRICYVSNKLTGTCYTKCPYGKQSNVGSWGCTKCEHFLRDDELNKIVDCNHP